MKKNKLIALFAGLSLAFVSSAALAAPSADTLLVAGYDSETMAVLYGVSDIDQSDEEPASLDCTLFGEFIYELNDGAEVADDATEAEVTGLWTKDETATDNKGAPAEFFGEDVPSDERVPTEGVAYGTPSDGEDTGAEECALTSVKIEPNGNGEINHGTIVSTFAKLLKGGNGCMIRHFAQSEFGKEDQSELDLDTTAPEVLDEQLTVTLQFFETACAKGKDKKVDDDSESGVKANGKDKAPGLKDKADKGGKKDAPGQLKKASQGDDNGSND